MKRFYTESIWNERQGLNVIRVFEQGEPLHFAVFYDEKKAKDYVAVLNKEKSMIAFRFTDLQPLEEG